MKFTYVGALSHDYLSNAHAMRVNDLSLIYEALDRAKTENDIELLLGVIWELGASGISDEYFKLTLQVVRPLIEIDDIDVRQALMNLLARARQRHPDEVDDFLHDNFLGATTQRQVRTMEVEEQIGGDLLFLPAVSFFAEAACSPIFNQQITWALKRAVECRNVTQWITLVAKKVVNLVYGDEIFKLQKGK